MPCCEEGSVAQWPVLSTVICLCIIVLIFSNVLFHESICFWYPPVTDGDKENVDNFGIMNMKVTQLHSVHHETWHWQLSVSGEWRTCPWTPWVVNMPLNAVSGEWWTCPWTLWVVSGEHAPERREWWVVNMSLNTMSDDC